MRYRQNQGSKARRIKPRHVFLLKGALDHLCLKVAATNPSLRNRARLIGNALPACAPYELRLFPHEWEVVSKALRPVGSSPPKGSLFAKWFALYTLLRKTFVFATEGEDARVRSLSSRRVNI